MATCRSPRRPTAKPYGGSAGRTSRDSSSRLSAVWPRCLVERGKVDEADRLIAEAERRVGRDDVWTRASLLHARGLVLAAQGRTEEAEAAFQAALEMIEPTMYSILTREIRASLQSVRAAYDVA